jgi:hypothetical protein
MDPKFGQPRPGSRGEAIAGEPMGPRAYKGVGGLGPGFVYSQSVD